MPCSREAGSCRLSCRGAANVAGLPGRPCQLLPAPVQHVPGGEELGIGTASNDHPPAVNVLPSSRPYAHFLLHSVGSTSRSAG